MLKTCAECPNQILALRKSKVLCDDCLLRHRKARFRRRLHTFGSRDWAARRMWHTRKRALARGIPYELTPRDIQAIAKSHRCYYCKIRKGIFTLERLDNDLGYTPANVVYACWPCNSFKSSIFTAQEMSILGPAFRKLRALRGHHESDYYLLGMGNIIRKAAIKDSRRKINRVPITRVPLSPGRPRKPEEGNPVPVRPEDHSSTSA